MRLLFLIFLLISGACELVHAQQKPNVILMLADDMGYSDIAAFGSEVPTPNIDRLASKGTTFTQFYNGARCCPTRASLLTGLYAHQAGVGYMNQNWNEEGYQGHLDDQARTVAEVMKANDYATFMVGKWHVGSPKNGQAPYERGFDDTWWRFARVDYFEKEGSVLQDGQPWVTQDPDYYLTDYTGDYASRYIEANASKKEPFFGYIGWDACHWPLQARANYIEEYLPTYEVGWDMIRQNRIARQMELGLIDPQWAIPGRDPAAPAWSELSQSDQAKWIRKMATYAAQLKSLDENIGKVVDKLEALGIADNTYIMLLFDNGACAEAIGWDEENLIGSPESYTAYNLPWANVSNTPFRTYKHFLNEGGISTPFIVAGPGIESQQTDAVGHIIDVVPTLLDLTKSSYINDPTVKPLEGQSLVPVLLNAGASGREWTFWEHEGSRAVRYGDWKLVSRYENDSIYYSRWHFPGEPRRQEWELYNLAKDRTEMYEVSEDHPVLVSQMITRWEEWATRVGVVQNVTSYDGKDLQTK